MNELLPVHGFVLAGGKSSRMGVDKALLRVGGLPMVQIAVEKLQTLCADVSIAGNRDDLAGFAGIVHEMRTDGGPAAGIEAGLRAAQQPWALFVPVDVPLVPAELLRQWAQQVIGAANPRVLVSYLSAAGEQPAFCMVRRVCAAALEEVLDRGERRLTRIFAQAARDGGVRVQDVRELPFGLSADVKLWFRNVNTPADLAEVGRSLAEDRRRAPGF